MRCTADRCWQCGGPYYGTEEQTMDGKRTRMECVELGILP